MTSLRPLNTALAAALVLCTTLTAHSQDFLLYTPKPVATGTTSISQEGVLVQEIEIKKGDTLSGISRRYNGRGKYYPQILLFNSIKNPNLIYAGQTLRVPVSHKEASGGERSAKKPSDDAVSRANTATDSKDPEATASSGSLPAASSPGSELSMQDLKSTRTDKRNKKRKKQPAVVHADKKSAPQNTPGAIAASPPPAVNKSAAVPPAAAEPNGQKLFEAAVTSYRKDDCQTALELLDRFLAENAGSLLAADANLYKAECFLKLSAH